MESINITQSNWVKMFGKYVSLNLVSIIGVSIYFLADTYFIANGINSNGIVALNLVLPIYSVIYGIAQMIAVGSGALYSVNTDNDYRKKIILNCLTFGSIIALIITILAQIFLRPLVGLLGADSQEVFEMTLSYFRIISCGAIFFTLSAIMSALVRNAGKPNIVMIASFIGSMGNVIFDYIYIYIFKWGMFGAGLATITSPIITVLIILPTFIKLFYHKKDISNKMKLSFRLFLNICRIGFSSFINELSSGVTILAFNMSLLKYLGEIGVAGYGIIANVALVFVAFFNGVATGIQPLTSSLYGKKDYSLLKKVLKLAILCELIIGILIVSYSLIFSDFTVSLFNKNNDIQLQQIASHGMKLYFISFMVTGIDICLVSFFASVIEPLKSSILSIMRGFAVIVPSVLILPLILGVNGIWLSIPFTDIITFIVAVLLLIKWAKKYDKKKLNNISF